MEAIAFAVDSMVVFVMAFAEAFGREVVRGLVAEVLFLSEALVSDPVKPPSPFPPITAKRAAPAAANTSASAAGWGRQCPQDRPG